MEARIVHRAELDGYDVYLVAPAGEAAGYVGQVNEHGRIDYVDRVVPGSEMRRTLHFTHHELEALKHALSPEEQPVLNAAAAEKVLEDARQVRDRLLTLVEEGWRSI